MVNENSASNYQSASGSFISQANNNSVAIINVFQAAQPCTIEPCNAIAAEDLLAQIPTEIIPPPKGIPLNSTFFWTRNRFFVGREDELRRLAFVLRNEGAAAVGNSPALTGLGGQGKTQTAIEFAYRYGAWFKGGVCWINFGNPSVIPESIAACGPALYPDDAGFSERTLAQRLALVSSAWASSMVRLLIFDNCEDEALFDTWAPKGGACRILLTSRLRSWSAARGVTILGLGQLTAKESRKLLHNYAPEYSLDDINIAAIAHELGYLPLALELAGHYLARYKNESFGTPEAYLIELRSPDILSHTSLVANDPGGKQEERTLTGHERDVAKTFELSFRLLSSEKAESRLARHVFYVASWLAPGELIPRDLLRDCCSSLSIDIHPTLFADALKCLVELALLDSLEGNGAVKMHRLLSAFGRRMSDESNIARNEVQATILIKVSKLIEINDPRGFENIAPHMIVVAHNAVYSNDMKSAEILHGCGQYFRLMSNYVESESMFKDALIQAQRMIGQDDVRLVGFLTSLADVQIIKGKIDVAEKNINLAFQLLQTSSLGLVMEKGFAYHTLAKLSMTVGNWANALKLLKNVLANFKSSQEITGLDIAMALGNLGISYLELGYPRVARRLQRKALELESKVLGVNHIDVAITMGNLGNTERVLKNWKLAESLYVRSIDILVFRVGKCHSSVGIIQGNLGLVKAEIGQVAEAKESIRNAMENVRLNFGKNHVEYGRLLTNLADVIYRYGEKIMQCYFI